MKFELVHDHLAKAIYEAVSIEQQQEKHAYALIDARYEDYLQDQEVLLGQGELEFIRPFLEEMELGDKKRAFVQKSQHKLLLGKRRLRMRNYAIIAMATTFIFLPLAIWGVKAAFDAKTVQMTAEEEVVRTNEALAKAEKENHSLRRVITGDTMPRIMNMNDLEGDDFENIRNAETIYATMHLSGRVIDQSGQAVSNARVELMGAILKTNKRGGFECYFVMPPLLRSKSGFFINVDKAGYTPHRAKVKPNAEVELTLTLNSKQK